MIARHENKYLWSAYVIMFQSKIITNTLENYNNKFLYYI